MRIGRRSQFALAGTHNSSGNPVRLLGVYAVEKGKPWLPLRHDR
jgi:hypothetical protein